MIKIENKVNQKLYTHNGLVSRENENKNDCKVASKLCRLPTRSKISTKNRNVVNRFKMFCSSTCERYQLKEI